MAHARTIPLLLTTLAVVLVLPGAALAGETREIEKANASWTIPDSLSFMEINSNEESNLYVAKAGGADAGGQGYVILSLRAFPNDDPNFLKELTQEVKDNIAGQFNELKQSSIGTASLAGVQGTLVKIKGKNHKDLQAEIRIYSIQIDNRIHQMFVQFNNTSDAKLRVEADKARRGYRLKSGGGDEPADPELAQGGSDPDEEEEVEDEGEDPLDGTGRRPLREDDLLTFGARNLRWGIPDGSPFEWNDVTPNQKMKSGRLCRAAATIELEVTEEQKARGAPTENKAEIILRVQELGAGGSPKNLVNSQENHTKWEKNFFDSVDWGRMKIIEELDVGNYTGSAAMMVGKKDNHVRFLRVYSVGLKENIYIWFVVLTGNRNVNDDFKGALKNLMGAVEFLNTETWIRGPLAVPGVQPFDGERGEGLGEQKKVPSMGFEATKPKPMVSIEFQKGGNLRLAWEMRSEDKQKYLYFDVQTWSERSVRGAKEFTIDRVRDREGQWKEHVESPTTIKKGKEPYFKASFGKGKGVGYEFHGYHGEVPFMERGFVVKHKKFYFWIRIQLGGQDAEKTFAKELKGLKKKAIKYSR